jgi:general secretion pathway protein D
MTSPARLLLLIAALAAPVRAADDATIAFNLQDVELPVLAKFVSEVTGRNFIVDDRVRGKVTVISPTRITPDEAYLVFQSVLQVKGFTTVPAGNFIKIVPAHDAVASGGRAGDQVVTRVIPLHHAEVAGLLPAVQPLVSKDGVINAYPQANSLIVVDSGANVERLAALVADLDARQGKAPAATRLHVRHLKYADAEGLVRVLSQLVGAPLPPPAEPRPHGSQLMRDEARRVAATGNYALAPTPVAAPEPVSTGTASGIPLEAPVRITADPATNALIVSATPGDWATLAGVIDDLDVRRRQVFVEAIILETTVEKTRALGVEFQAATALDGHVGIAQANLSSLAGAVANPTSLPGLLLAAASNKKVTLPNGDSVPAQTLLLTALQTDNDLNVLSAPNIITTDNEEAEIVVGRNVPFVASRATSGTNLENLFTTITRHDVGITLRMTPQISADDFVRLALFEEVSDLDETASLVVGDPSMVGPTTTIRSASTEVGARDGQTVVIGGLLADTVRGNERSVPYLGHIPVLGALFRRNDDRHTKTNLLVFLTPHIIASDQQMTENSLEQRDRMRAAVPPTRAARSALGGRGWQAPPDAPAPARP